MRLELELALTLPGRMTNLEDSFYVEYNHHHVDVIKSDLALITSWSEKTMNQKVNSADAGLDVHRLLIQQRCIYKGLTLYIKLGVSDQHVYILIRVIMIYTGLTTKALCMGLSDHVLLNRTFPCHLYHCRSRSDPDQRA
jgi:hypothetical protein